MIRNFFLPASPKSPVAKFCVDLIYRNRFEGSEGRCTARHLADGYAEDAEFIGSLLGLVDFASQRLTDPTPQKEITRQVVEALFGEHRDAAYATIGLGPDNAVLMCAFEETQRKLTLASSRPRGQSEEEFLLWKHYF